MIDTQDRPETQVSKAYDFNDLGVTTRHRCDRCGAQAFALASRSDMRLTLCGHHSRMYAPALIGKGWIIDDRTHLINEKPSVSANSH